MLIGRLTMNNDVSYFDYKCEELFLHRKYLHYLQPSSLNLVFLLIKCKTKKEICNELNKISTSHFEVTISRLDKRIRSIRSQLYNLVHYSEIFGINESIHPASLEDLTKIVNKYLEELKNDE